MSAQRDENETEGFVISGTDIGLRMKALEYWRCAELGLAAGEGCPARGFKIVIAEALANQGVLFGPFGSRMFLLFITI